MPGFLPLATAPHGIFFINKYHDATFIHEQHNSQGSGLATYITQCTPPARSCVKADITISSNFSYLGCSVRGVLVEWWKRSLMPFYITLYLRYIVAQYSTAQKTEIVGFSTDRRIYLWSWVCDRRVIGTLVSEDSHRWHRYLSSLDPWGWEPLSRNVDMELPLHAA
jgi:hypothetical protein